MTTNNIPEQVETDALNVERIKDIQYPLIATFFDRREFNPSLLVVSAQQKIQ